MKRRPLSILLLVLVIAGGVLLYGAYRGRDGNGQSAGTTTPPVTAHADTIVITSPAPGATVTSPITVSGRARGTWFFEASAPVVVLAAEGLIVGEGHIQAEGDWMTTDFVPFTGTIEYTVPSDRPHANDFRGTLLFKKDNPSGLPEHEDSVEVPVVFGQ